MGQFDVLSTGDENKAQVAARVEREEIMLDESMDLATLESKIPVLAPERDHSNRFYYARKLNDAVTRTLGALDPSTMSFEDLLRASDIFATSQLFSSMGGRSGRGVDYPEGFTTQEKRFADELEKRVDQLATEGKAEEVPEDWRKEGAKRGDIRKYQETFMRGTGSKHYSIQPDSEEGKLFLDRKKKFNSLWEKR